MNKMTMKMSAVLSLAAGVILLQPVASQADDLFQLAWRGHSYARGANGDVVRSDFSEQDLINKVAQDNGLNPATLVFVYRVAAHDTAVVRASTGAFVADVIQFGLPNIGNSLN